MLKISRKILTAISIVSMSFILASCDQSLNTNNIGTNKFNDTQTKQTNIKSTVVPNIKSNSNVSISLFNEYLQDIETQTNRKISDEQRNLLINYISNSNIQNLPKSITDERRKEFNKKKKSLLTEWGNHYNTSWTKYTENLISKTSGKILRKVGNNYEAHHIIELDYGGENSWYNLHPATFYEHQNIHRKGSIGNKLFSENVGE